MSQLKFKIAMSNATVYATAIVGFRYRFQQKYRNTRRKCVFPHFQLLVFSSTLFLLPIRVFYEQQHALTAVTATKHLVQFLSILSWLLFIRCGVRHGKRMACKKPVCHYFFVKTIFIDKQIIEKVCHFSSWE